MANLNIPSKNTGDTLSADEFNQVVSAVMVRLIQLTVKDCLQMIILTQISSLYPGY